MTAPLSRDLRERIVRSVSGGTSIRHHIEFRRGEDGYMHVRPTVRLEGYDADLDLLPPEVVVRLAAWLWRP